jgi:hypothetical protein
MMRRNSPPSIAVNDVFLFTNAQFVANVRVCNR